MRQYSFKYIKILSDSQAAIQAMGNTEITSITVRDAEETWEHIAENVAKQRQPN